MSFVIIAPAQVKSVLDVFQDVNKKESHMALAENWETFIRLHSGEAGARDMFEKVMEELLRKRKITSVLFLK